MLNINPPQTDFSNLQWLPCRTPSHWHWRSSRAYGITQLRPLQATILFHSFQATRQCMRMWETISESCSQKGHQSSWGLRMCLFTRKALVQRLSFKTSHKVIFCFWRTNGFPNICDISCKTSIPDPFKGKHTRVYNIASILPPFPNQSVFFQSMNNCKIKIRQ